MELYIFRHGHTVWNGEHRFQGQTDIPLDELGLRQVACLAQRAKELDFKRLFTSPLTRARQTAQAIAQVKHLEIEPWDDLLEVDFGSWEGLKVSEVAETFPEFYDCLWKDPMNCNPEGKERLETVIARAQRVLDRCTGEFSGENLGIATHGYYSSVLMSLAIARPWEQLGDMLVRNATLSVLRWDGAKWTLPTMGDAAHLEAMDG